MIYYSKKNNINLYSFQDCKQYPHPSVMNKGSGILRGNTSDGWDKTKIWCNDRNRLFLLSPHVEWRLC